MSSSNWRVVPSVLCCESITAISAVRRRTGECRASGGYQRGVGRYGLTAFS